MIELTACVNIKHIPHFDRKACAILQRNSAWGCGRGQAINIHIVLQLTKQGGI